MQVRRDTSLGGDSGARQTMMAPEPQLELLWAWRTLVTLRGVMETAGGEESMAVM